MPSETSKETNANARSSCCDDDVVSPTSLCVSTSKPLPNTNKQQSSSFGVSRANTPCAPPFVWQRPHCPMTSIHSLTSTSPTIHRPRLSPSPPPTPLRPSAPPLHWPLHRPYPHPSLTRMLPWPGARHLSPSVPLPSDLLPLPSPLVVPLRSPSILPFLCSPPLSGTSLRPLSELLPAPYLPRPEPPQASCTEVPFDQGACQRFEHV